MHLKPAQVHWMIHKKLYLYLTPWNRNPAWDSNSSPVFNKFSIFGGTWSFITVFTGVHHWIISWAVWIQSTSSDPVSWWWLWLLIAASGSRIYFDPLFLGLLKIILLGDIAMSWCTVLLHFFLCGRIIKFCINYFIIQETPRFFSNIQEGLTCNRSKDFHLNCLHLILVSAIVQLSLPWLTIIKFAYLASSPLFVLVSRHMQFETFSVMSLFIIYNFWINRPWS
jgi:hypothetical protein